MIRSSEKTGTPADKTSNIYRLGKTEHCKLLHRAITTTYKKADRKTSDDINKAGIRFAKDAKVIDKMEINTRND